MFPFLIFGFFAEVIASSIGFGASTILLPLALLYFDFKTALTLTAFFHLFGTISRSYLFHSNFNKKFIFYFGLSSAIFSIIGAYFANSLTQTHLKGSLGLFFIIYGSFSLTNGVHYPKSSKTNLLLGGTISGFLAGLLGTGGALRATFLSALERNKKEYLATTAAISLMVDLTRIPVYLSAGFLSDSLFFWLPLLFLVATLAAYLGKRIALLIPIKLFEKIIYLGITLIGCWFVLK